MFDPIDFKGEFFDRLWIADKEIIEKARTMGCRWCGGRLYRGDFPRKARGDVIATLTAALDRRFSLCCGREGCRKRATPPSLRFLGRRVYAGAVVIIASAIAVHNALASEIKRKTGVPARTVHRWIHWWRGSFTKTSVFIAICARLLPPPPRSELPESILVRLRGSIPMCVEKFLAMLAPITTSSMPNGSRFVKGAA
jgi:hypothetical protein